MGRQKQESVAVISKRKLRRKDKNLRSPQRRQAALDELDYAEREAAVRERLWSNAALLASATIGVIAIIRLLTVARYNHSTALAIVGSASPGLIILGTLVFTIPLGLQLVVTQIGIEATFAESSQNRIKLWFIYTVLMLLMARLASRLTFYLCLAPIAVLIIGWGVMRIANWRKSGKSRTEPDRTWLRGPLPNDAVLRELRTEYEQARKTSSIDADKILRIDLVKSREARLDEIIKKGNERVGKIQATSRKGRETAVLTAIIVALTQFIQNLIASDRPWLPAELVKLKDSTILVGYPLKQDSKWISILREQDRTVIQVKIDDVDSRKPCSLRPESDQINPILFALSDKIRLPSYEKCPSS